jgi:hypothetical protein
LTPPTIANFDGPNLINQAKGNAENSPAPPPNLPNVMPTIGAMDPAYLVAKECVDSGFLRQLEQPCQILLYPGLGGSGGYALWYRQQQLERFNAGGPIDVSKSSIYQWADCPEPFCQTGNCPRMGIVGVDLLNLVMFIMAWPDASLSGQFSSTTKGGGSIHYSGSLQMSQGA